MLSTTQKTCCDLRGTVCLCLVPTVDLWWGWCTIVLSAVSFPAGIHHTRVEPARGQHLLASGFGSPVLVDCSYEECRLVAAQGTHFGAFNFVVAWAQQRGSDGV